MRQRKAYRRLCDLHLSPVELEALKTQGFVSEEHRGKRRYYKLRYRSGGRQRVRYIGACSRQAEEIQRELNKLQESRRHRDRIAQMTKQARILMRNTKRVLAPLLREVGYHYYGFEIRKTRTKKTRRESAE